MNATEPDPKSTINEQLTSFYQSKEVPSSLTELIASAKTPSPELMPQSDRRGTNRLAWLTVAAAAVVLAGLFIMPAFFPGDDTISTQAGLVRNLAAEVAAHHVAAGDLGVVTSSLDEAQLALTRLDFDISPFPAAFADFKLVGAKHCSLHGQVAAQLKVLAPGDESPCTLYVTRMSDDLKAIPDSETTVDGVRVRHLRDDGRLFMLAYGG